MSFLNPLFLLGLTAVAVPVIVHLVRRTRAPRVEFPSLMFVRRIPQRTIRRRRMQNWLLFALRCLAFMLLVSAFVRPYFGSGQADADRERAQKAAEWVFTVLVVLPLYVAPSVVAFARRHVNRVPILALNLLLGWTLLGWVLALVWALMAAAPQQQVHVHYHEPPP